MIGELLSLMLTTALISLRMLGFSSILLKRVPMTQQCSPDLSSASLLMEQSLPAVYAGGKEKSELALLIRAKRVRTHTQQLQLVSKLSSVSTIWYQDSLIPRPSMQIFFTAVEALDSRLVSRLVRGIANFTCTQILLDQANIEANKSIMGASPS